MENKRVYITILSEIQEEMSDYASIAGKGENAGKSMF